MSDPSTKTSHRPSGTQQDDAASSTGTATKDVAESGRADEGLLLEFLRGHDAACPVCRYNLRALTRPVCPECRHELVLAVGVARPRLGWLVVALAPGFFSGVAAMFLLVPIVLRLVVGDGRVSWPLVPVDLFGWLSGAFAVVLSWRRLRFVALPVRTQRRIALTVWAVHAAALLVVALVIIVIASR